MRATITGATGLLGGNLAIELLKQGHEVRATKRSTSRVAHLSEFDIEWVEADLGDLESLKAAFSDSDAVFHCAAQVSIRKHATPDLVSVNIDGTRNVLDAVRATKIPRLVYTSTVGAIGLMESDEPCTEDSRWNFADLGMDDGYVTTKHEAQEIVLDAAANGLDVVLVNPTYMLGPYDARPSSGKMLINVTKQKTPGWTPGYNNYVDVRDVARGMILAHEKGGVGEKYILGNKNLTYKEIFDLIAKVAGVEPPSWRVPRPLARVFGWVGDIQEWISGKDPFINTVTVRYGYCKTFQFSSEKAKRELGYSPSSIETALEDALEWFRANSYL